MRLVVREHGQSLESCMTLCDPMDCSPPGSSVHGILQARIVEWVAVPVQAPPAEDQPRLIQGIRRRDGIGEDQETIA